MRKKWSSLNFLLQYLKLKQHSITLQNNEMDQNGCLHGCNKQLHKGKKNNRLKRSFKAL